jgi:hypothetical protein
LGEEREEEERRPGVPKYYYWAKSPPKPKKMQTKFINTQQKKFYVVQLAFRAAQVAAILTVLFIYFNMLS